MRKVYIMGVLVVVMSTVLGACTPTQSSTTAPERTISAPSPALEKPPTSIIKDLAYIQGSGGGYSDDADPEDEGVQISFLWYDTRSEWIIYKNIPISVDIELYPRGFDMKLGEYTLGRRIYKGQVHIDGSLSHIRIPFEDIKATPTTNFMFSVAKVIIHTPQQGDYSIEFVVAVSFELD